MGISIQQFSMHDNVQQYSSFILADHSWVHHSEDNVQYLWLVCSFTLAGPPVFTAAHHFFGRAHIDTGKTFHGRLRKARDFVEYSQYAAV